MRLSSPEVHQATPRIVDLKGSGVKGSGVIVPIGVLLRLYGDNGTENGNAHNGLYRV